MEEYNRKEFIRTCLEHAATKRNRRENLRWAASGMLAGMAIGAALASTLIRLV